MDLKNCRGPLREAPIHAMEAATLVASPAMRSVEASETSLKHTEVLNDHEWAGLCCMAATTRHFQALRKARVKVRTWLCNHRHLCCLLMNEADLDACSATEVRSRLGDWWRAVTLVKLYVFGYATNLVLSHSYAGDIQVLLDKLFAEGQRQLAFKQQTEARAVEQRNVIMMAS